MPSRREKTPETLSRLERPSVAPSRDLAVDIRAGCTFAQPSTHRDQATKAMRVIVGGLLEKNTSRAFRMALSAVESAIDSRIDAANRKAKDGRSG